MSPALLLPVTLLANLITNVFKKKYSLLYPGNVQARYVYQFVGSAVSALFFFCIGGRFHVSPLTLWLSILFGTITAFQQIFNLKAVEIGSLSYTTVIVSLSMLIPTFSGSIFWDEAVAPIQYMGLALMVACIVLSTDFRKQNGAVNCKWLLYTGITFFLTGAIGVTQKIQQSSEAKGELLDFLFLSFLVSAILSGILFLSNRSRETHCKKLSELRIPALLLIITGISAALNNLINLSLSGVMNSAVFYPIVNGGSLILTALSAVILFHEKLPKKQWLGIVLGMIAVLCLCNPFQS